MIRKLMHSGVQDGLRPISRAMSTTMSGIHEDFTKQTGESREIASAIASNWKCFRLSLLTKWKEGDQSSTTRKCTMDNEYHPKR